MKMLFLGILFVALTASAAAQDPASDDLKRLQGTWRMTSVVIDGKKVHEDDLKHMTVIFRGDTYIVKNEGKEVEKGTQKLDPTKTPRAIDAHVLEGADKGKDQLGIYELTGDTLKICFAAPGQERPKEFSSHPGSKHEYGVFQRPKQ
jgi:uncharacterized protein (TIGR03067 family)